MLNQRFAPGVIGCSGWFAGVGSGCLGLWQVGRLVLAAYGAVAAIVPAALFALGNHGRFVAQCGVGDPRLLYVGGAVNQSVVPGHGSRLVVNLNWLALLAGLFVTLKMVLVALLKRPPAEKRIESLRE